MKVLVIGDEKKVDSFIKRGFESEGCIATLERNLLKGFNQAQIYILL